MLAKLLLLLSLLLLASLILLESLNNPVASAVATNTAVADVIAGCFPSVPAVVMVSAVADGPAAVVVLTAVDVTGGCGLILCCCRRHYCC